MTWTTDYCRNTTKKRSEVKKSAKGNINKMAMGLETLRNGGQDLQEGNPFHPRHHWTTNLMTWTTDYCRNTAKSGQKVKRSA
jgi:hypothetical protein